jgi:hypothetical protein
MIYGRLHLKKKKEVYLPLETTLVRRWKSESDLPLEMRTGDLPLE